jgi:hypothetical protein
MYKTYTREVAGMADQQTLAAPDTLRACDL